MESNNHENAYYKALKILNLPPFVTKDEIKKQYRYLAKKYHPDIYKDSNKILEINSAYKLLMEYIDNFRYSFDDEELNKQMPNLSHSKKFKP